MITYLQYFDGYVISGPIAKSSSKGALLAKRLQIVFGFGSTYYTNRQIPMFFFMLSVFHEKDGLQYFFSCFQFFMKKTKFVVFGILTIMHMCYHYLFFLVILNLTLSCDVLKTQIFWGVLDLVYINLTECLI